MTEPNPPGSPEARAIIAAWRDSRCAYRFGDGLGCPEEGVFERDGKFFCSQHKRRGASTSPTFNEPLTWGAS
jgi:hypothetical protein